MNGITAEPVERYLKELQPERDVLLARLEHEAQARDIPIIGPVAGRLLYVIAKLRRAKHILEFGTAIGYSALWFARATEPWGGRITTIEIKPEMAAEARRHFEEAGVANRVEILVGDGLSVAKSLEGSYDLCFLDADKQQYKPIIERIWPRITPGGVILADNVLWSGRVAEEDPDETTQAIREFNRYVMSHPELETVIVPLRDGISLSIKKS